MEILLVTLDVTDVVVVASAAAVVIIAFAVNKHRDCSEAFNLTNKIFFSLNKLYRTVH